MKAEKTCCVFGHRTISGKEKLKKNLSNIFETLIMEENVTTFLLGSKSEFNTLCQEVLCIKKEKHPHIQRIYIRAEYPDICEDYESYLLKQYDKTYFPQQLRNAGKAVYVERNYEMINQSDICVVYYKEEAVSSKQNNRPSKSGTSIAYHYAKKKKKKIINVI